MKIILLVAIILSAQTVLPGAATDCECAPHQEAQLAASECCPVDGPTRCEMHAAPDATSEPATVVTSTTIQPVVAPTGTAMPAVEDSRATSLKLTAAAHPTGLWSARVCAERAPPLS